MDFRFAVCDLCLYYWTSDLPCVTCACITGLLLLYDLDLVAEMGDNSLSTDDLLRILQGNEDDAEFLETESLDDDDFEVSFLLLNN